MRFSLLLCCCLGSCKNIEELFKKKKKSQIYFKENCESCCTAASRWCFLGHCLLAGYLLLCHSFTLSCSFLGTESIIKKTILKNIVSVLAALVHFACEINCCAAYWQRRLKKKRIRCGEKL